ncbi:MAG: amidohydrolase family protein [Lachnospiraceae bacterium]
MKTDMLIYHAVLVTMDPDRAVLFDGAMAIDKGRIVATGESAKLVAEYSEAVEKINCEGKIVVPGFINTHNHLFQTLLKGLGDDMVLSDWLKTMTFPAASFLEPDDCYYAAMTGILEGVRSGMTTEVDYMYPHAREGLSDAIIRAYREIGIRGVFGRGCMDEGRDYGIVPEIMQDQKTVEKDLVRLFDTYHNIDNERIKIWTAPAALWSNSRKMLQMLYEITNAYGAGLTVHVSETPFDRQATEALHHSAGVDCLEQLGMTGPNILMVHCVYLTDSDIKKAAEYDLKVSHNPVSNMYLASGVAPIKKMLQNKINVSLGVDGAASNNGQDMLELMKTTALLQKVSTLDPVSITAEKVLELATIDGARALGLEDQIGSLEVGKKADFVIFDPFLSPKAVPMHNPVSTIVYSSTMQNVESVAVDGTFILKDGKMVNVSDERLILKKAQAAADSLCIRGNITNRRQGHRWQSQ